MHLLQKLQRRNFLILFFTKTRNAGDVIVCERYMGIIKKIIRFFDLLENKVRGRLSRHPVIYALIGGVAVVLFWKGVWETAARFPILDGPMSIVVSLILLLITGLFVSFFIGDTILISGIREEKKLSEKTEKEIVAEVEEIREVKEEIEKIEYDLSEIKDSILIKNGKKKSRKKI